MTEDYLDITKSVMISSPAGSGKTEKLARRYIALLRNGSDVERILAVTFTEKAAAEMKERIVGILRTEDPALFEAVREKVPRMRISTIHSFCLKLVRRFCLELQVDPSLQVIDPFGADLLWSESIYESLLEDERSGRKLFYELIRDKGIKGWNKLYAVLHELHGRRPTIELGMKGLIEAAICSGDHPSDNVSRNHLEKIVSLYAQCLGRYRAKKLQRHVVDYSDLELMAYEAISANPEWHNILFSFDEHTDHILVDEFQDTSSLQWKIIDKLTEEWRSGLGPKRESGMKPTVFVVGDDKQSIYSFRGANVTIFREARKRLSEWLGGEYHFIEVKENYRSLPAIVNFVNALFERLMPSGLSGDLKIDYSPFEATREGEGKVELVLLEHQGSIREGRKREAAHIARKIAKLRGEREIHDEKAKRPCTYGDIAILLRGRTHLSVFEDALRKEAIPFVVVKGIGFYQTPEIALVKSLLFFVIDPKDDYSLFTVLRSPLFGLDYDFLQSLIGNAGDVASSYGVLYEALSACADGGRPGEPLQEKLWASPEDGEKRQRCREIVDMIRQWTDRARAVTYSVLLEEMLAETAAWRYFHERQRYLNVKKFIALVEEFEMKAFTALEIREKLIRASASADEAKANVNTEGMDAVKLMTIHAAKGLQFPVVFLPCLDEENRGKGGGAVALDEDGGRIVIGYEDDPELRKAVPLFQRQKMKTEEEEKRIFYVAATRAMDYLSMSGVVKHDQYTGKLCHLLEAFRVDEAGEKTGGELLEVTRIVASEPGEAQPALPRPSPIPPGRARIEDQMVHVEPIDYRPLVTWHDVTEERETVRKKHGEDWVVLGRAFHRLFEGLSKGSLTADDCGSKVSDILRNETMSDGKLQSMEKIIMAAIATLKESGLLEQIILPKQNAYAELPFILRKGSRIYRGRIDRVIIKDSLAHIYDYKTYPVKENEIPELKENYAFQMRLYREAVERIFSLKTKSFLVFTHRPLVVEATP